ncbi:MAG: DNA polymerase III subunit delta [Bacteroidota bacterium]|nr:DNA polymerase III subunit delta [Bacteroidota bacterium]
MTAEQILKDLKNKVYKPVYFLSGEEPYYIDKIAEYVQNNVLSEDEKSFNQTVVYGKDTTIEDVILNARKFPMISDYQVVIVKEAQELAKNIAKLESYVEHPEATTILVICYKKLLDKRIKLTKLLEKNDYLYEGKKIYENKLESWIDGLVKESGYSIEPKAAKMLADAIGINLSRIHNEIEKLKITIPKERPITPEDIERNIGISKDFNVFELQDALAEKNFLKAKRIIDYFQHNGEADRAIVLSTASALFTFFSKVMMYHGLSDKSQASKVLGVNPYFVGKYRTASVNYPMKKISYILQRIKQIDLKSKGVGAAALPRKELLQELLFTFY